MNGEPDVQSNILRAIGRREFLRAAAGGALAASGIFGCGGGGNGGGGGGGVSGDQRSQSLKAIRDYVNSLPDQPRDTYLTNVLNFVKARPEILGAGTNADGVWIIYPDGFPLSILDNQAAEDLPPDLRSVPLPVSRAGTDTPAWRRARFINAMGNAFPDVTVYARNLVQTKGYLPLIDPGTVGSLKGVQEDGIFYIAAHGGQCNIPIVDASGNPVRDSNGKPTFNLMYGIWTTDLYDFSNPNQYLSDVRANRIGLMLMPNTKDANGNPVKELHYCITSNFVRQYMHFGDHSLVWLSACSGNSADSVGFVQALIASGAGLVFGWDNAVSGSAIVAQGRFVIDRLLGSNTTSPKETPPQRPFDYEQVWTDLQQHGLETYPIPAKYQSSYGPTTRIKYTPGAGNFGLLAPTLHKILINEWDGQAILRGIFGNPASADQIVLIGGQPVTIVSWDEHQIICTLPKTGASSYGDVQVIARGHESNIRRITEWDFHFVYTWSFASKPGLMVSGPVDLRFRADVGDYRDFAHDAPIQPLRTATPISDFQDTLVASGSFNDGCDNTWSGSKTVKSASLQPAAPDILVAYLEINTSADPNIGTRQGNLGLGFGAQDPQWFTWTVTCPGSPSTTIKFAIAALTNTQHDFQDPTETGHPPVPLFSFPITFQNDFSVAAGVILDQGPGGDPTIRWDWPAVTPKSPPDPAAARSIRRK